MNMYVKLTILR